MLWNGLLQILVLVENRLGEQCCASKVWVELGTNDPELETFCGMQQYDT